jgi:hypothetical protein
MRERVKINRMRSKVGIEITFNKKNAKGFRLRYYFAKRLSVCIAVIAVENWVIGCMFLGKLFIMSTTCLGTLARL